MSSSCLALENNIECRRKTDVIFYLEQKKKKIIQKVEVAVKTLGTWGKLSPFFSRVL